MREGDTLLVDSLSMVLWVSHVSQSDHCHVLSVCGICITFCLHDFVGIALSLIKFLLHAYISLFLLLPSTFFYILGAMSSISNVLH